MPLSPLQLRVEVRRRLNEAVAVLTPGGSDDPREVSRRLVEVVALIGRTVPDHEREARRQERLRHHVARGRSANVLVASK